MIKKISLLLVLLFVTQIALSKILPVSSYHSNVDPTIQFDTPYEACLHSVNYPSNQNNFVSMDVNPPTSWNCYCHSNPDHICGDAYVICPTGTEATGGGCADNASDTEHKPKPKDCGVGQPIDPMMGMMTHHFELFRVNSVFPIIAAYDYSYRQSGQWFIGLNRNIQLATVSGSQYLYLHRDDGSVYKFLGVVTGSGNQMSWITYSDTPYQVVTLGSGLQVILKSGITETYNANGQFTQEKNIEGYTHSLAYQYSGATLVGYTVTDDATGSSVHYGVDVNGKITSVSLVGDSLSFNFYYTGNMLTSISGPEGTQQYLYGKAFDTTALTAVNDETGYAYLQWDYDSSTHFATMTKLGSNVEVYNISYTVDGLGQISTAVVTNASGATKTYTYESSSEGVRRLTGTTGAAIDSCAATSYANTYETSGVTQGFLRTTKDARGYITEYTRNAQGRVTVLEKSLSSNERVLPESEMVETDWHTNTALNLPIQKRYRGSAGTSWKATPYRTIDFTYDDATHNCDGNSSLNTFRICSMTITDNLPGATAPRTWNYSYTLQGSSSALLTQTITDPRGNATLYTYNATGSSDSGQLASVKDAANHITNYTVYNGFGLPSTITDANAVTTLGYDALGRLHTSSTAGALTTIDYYPNGLVKDIISPDTTYLEYRYNSAHQLTDVEQRKLAGVGVAPDDINDQTFGKIHYTPSVLNGKWTDASTKDVSNNVVLAQHRVFDALGRLWKQQNAVNVDKTIFNYDTNDNLLTITNLGSPSNVLNSRVYDAQNRITSEGCCTTTPTINTNYTYDDQGNISKVTDANNHITTYSYNGFGELVTQASPDSGTTNYTYDNAGNLLTKTKGFATADVQTITYGYDTLNRLQTIDYGSDSAIDRRYEYDLANHGSSVGRLSRITSYAADGVQVKSQEDYQYDALGNVTTYTLVVDNTTYTTQYAYDSVNHITKLTYPGGFIVNYYYASGKLDHVTTQVTSAAAEQTALSAISYLPFGPIKTLHYSNGLDLSLPRDADYRLTDIDVTDGTAVINGANTGGTSNRMDRHLSYDAFNNINGVTNYLNASRNWLFQYDAMQRLNDVTGPLRTAAQDHMAMTYDNVGNRLTRNINSGAVMNEAYTVDALSNHLISVNDTVTPPMRSFGYDGRGNVATDTQNSVVKTLIMDNQDRLNKVTSTANSLITTLGTYVYNAQGQRISKQLGTNPKTYYHYNQQGQLLAESTLVNAQSQILRNYLYVDGKLVTISVPDDDDGDGVAAVVDNCLTVANADQSNSDGDAAGNACDAFPNNAAASIDADSDGHPDSWNSSALSQYGCAATAKTCNGLTLDKFPSDPTKWGNVAKSNFNADADSDVLWYNSTNGDVNSWDMQNGLKNSWNYVGTWADTTNTPSLDGDFDGDGDADVLWYNATTGNVNIWDMQAGAKVNWRYIGYWAATANKPVAVGDFDGDGDDDILWWNSSTGDVNIWVMQGGVKVNWLYVGYWSDVTNIPLLVGDFDGDGDDDILWWNNSSGNVNIWVMQANAKVNWLYVGVWPDVNNKPVGVGDVNNDGTDDILWWNKNTGDVNNWTMLANARSSWTYIGSWSDINNHIEEVGDFNGDGTADILWRNISTGSVTSWPMLNGVKQTGIYIGIFPGTTNSIKAGL